MESLESQAPPLDNYKSLVSAFTEFLTVAVHTILFERDIYPRESFISARKYNCAVRQSRHPAVCTWIKDAVAAVEAEMLKCSVAQTSVIIYSAATNVPLERYVFSTDAFPVVPPEDLLTPFEYVKSHDHEKAPPSRPTSKSRSTSPSPPPQADPNTSKLHTSSIDLIVQFPGVLSRLCLLHSKLKPLPKDCSFTIAIELRDGPTGEPPIGWPMPWVASEPGLQHKEASSSSEQDHIDRLRPAKLGVERGQYLGGAKTTPIRTVEAGPFAMEVWVEEGKVKMELPDLVSPSMPDTKSTIEAG